MPYGDRTGPYGEGPYTGRQGGNPRPFRGRMNDQPRKYRDDKIDTELGIIAVSLMSEEQLDKMLDSVMFAAQGWDDVIARDFLFVLEEAMKRDWIPSATYQNYKSQVDRHMGRRFGRKP